MKGQNIQKKSNRKLVQSWYSLHQLTAMLSSFLNVNEKPWFMKKKNLGH